MWKRSAGPNQGLGRNRFYTRICGECRFFNSERDAKCDRCHTTFIRLLQFLVESGGWDILPTASVSAGADPVMPSVPASVSATPSPVRGVYGYETLLCGECRFINPRVRTSCKRCHSRLIKPSKPTGASHVTASYGSAPARELRVQ